MYMNSYLQNFLLGIDFGIKTVGVDGKKIKLLIWYVGEWYLMYAMLYS